MSLLMVASQSEVTKQVSELLHAKLEPESEMITTVLLILLAGEVGFIFGWSVSEYRHAGRELRRVREQFAK